MFGSDITNYFLFLPLCVIPEIEITSRDISHKTLRILNYYPNAETAFLPIISWRFPDRFWSPRRIGWKNLSAEETLLHSWEAGKLEFTQFWESPEKKLYIPELSPEFQIGFSPLYSREGGRKGKLIYSWKVGKLDFMQSPSDIGILIIYVFLCS